MLIRKKKDYPRASVLIFAVSLIFAAAMSPRFGYAQVASGYEVATWYRFKTSAVTYTFDDNTAKQLTVALPLFDQYHFKATFFPVINWNPNWQGLRAASSNGHEVASHTVSHPHLGQLSADALDAELKQSQTTIQSNIPGVLCTTIAYPYCETGNIAALQKYYIAGRICSGVAEPKTPADFFRISSIVAGSESTVKTAQDFNSKVSLAKTANGWCVFLLHGIDNDGGYSPVQSAELNAHLAYINSNEADYWVAPFGQVARYIKERDAVSLVEITITADSLLLVAGDNLPDSVYNVPLTVRRKLPAGWQNARISSGGNVLDSEIATVGTEKYVVFDVVPDQGTVSLSKANTTSQNLLEWENNPPVRTNPNPFSENIKIVTGGEFTYCVRSLDGRMVETGNGNGEIETGCSLAPGIYFLNIRKGSDYFKKKIIKN